MAHHEKRAARAAEQAELITQARTMLKTARALQEKGKIGNPPELQSAFKGLEKFLEKPDAFGRRFLAKVHLMTIRHILHDWEVDAYPLDVPVERPS